MNEFASIYDLFKKRTRLITLYNALPLNNKKRISYLRGLMQIQKKLLKEIKKITHCPFIKQIVMSGIVHILKSKSIKKPYRVLNVGVNGEPLSPSQNFASKQNAEKNIIAHMHLYNGTQVTVQDNTLKVPKRYYFLPQGYKVHLDGKWKHYS